jgi:hypothetical protein
MQLYAVLSGLMPAGRIRFEIDNDDACADKRKRANIAGRRDIRPLTDEQQAEDDPEGGLKEHEDRDF